MLCRSTLRSEIRTLIMDPTEILNVRFHIGGEFTRIGPNMDYVGGEEAMSEIERDKLSLQEVKGYLQDHIQYKESMKLYFLLPGKDLINGLVFLYDDSGCVKMADYICVGGVADVYVEYHGEEDDDKARLCSPMKQRRSSIGQVGVYHDEMRVIEGSFSQVLDPTQVDHDEMALTEHADKQNSDSDSDSDNEYIGHTDDSGEYSEVVELRRHARKFKKRMRDTRSWIGRDATGPVPTGLIANLEEQIEKEEMDWNYDSSDEDYIYDEDSDGHIRRRKTTFPRYNPKSEVPHFALTMVFRSKNQLCKALRRYGLVTKRSILFMKSESDRVRAKCGWPGCPWLIYAAKRSTTSRF
ncbi:hypothetical protein ZWY2020_030684 [Hordeum vulgare]|nr:hypothetical protein ZWY2020_030684 [Hordeum vulgare]